MPMKMTRRPRVKRRIQPAVLAEVRDTLKSLGSKTGKKRSEPVSDWSHQPKFSYRTKVTKKEWILTLYHDKNSEAGKIYDWVDKGTGERGDDPNASAYVITPKRASALHFTLPMEIKTIADGGHFAPSFFAESQEVFTQMVIAPGIYPRHLDKLLYEKLQSRDSGSFHNEIEAAIKRAFRRMGIYVG